VVLSLMLRLEGGAPSLRSLTSRSNQTGAMVAHFMRARAGPKVHPKGANILSLRDPVSGRAYDEDEGSNAAPVLLPCSHTFTRDTIGKVWCTHNMMPFSRHLHSSVVLPDLVQAAHMCGEFC
jgi:hypothetical protein